MSFLRRPALRGGGLWAATLAAGLVVACTSRNPGTPSTPTPATPACASLTVDPANTTVDANGGDRTIVVTASSECSWAAAVASGGDAVSITDGASGRGNGSVKISVKVNAGAERRATITVGSASVALLQQAAVPCAFTVDPASLPFRSGGGAGTIAVAAQGTACSWSATSSDPFVTIVSGSQGTGNGTVSIAVAANTGAFRSGTLTVAGRTVTVTQDAAGVCIASLTPSSQTIDNAAYSGTIAVLAPDTCGWQVVSRASFVEIIGATRGNGNGVVSYRVAANGGVARVGTIGIGGLDFVVTQRADIQTAVYDPALRAPVCNVVAGGCDSGRLLEGSGATEQNQPNTLFSQCPDGAGAGHFAVVRGIKVSTSDGTTMTVGKRVQIFASLVTGSTADTIRIYYAPDALHPNWIYLGGTDILSGRNEFGLPVTLQPGELQAIRVAYAFGHGFGVNCAVGSDDDNDDLVFRVQPQ